MAIVGAQFDERWSLGKMTLPHSLAFLVMVEQIYRAKEIQKGSKYHHA
jgi:23S rRNA (pseudouridine1915-N3)-methyltransferase